MTDLQKKQEKLIETAQTWLFAEDNSSDSFARTMGLQLKEMTKVQRCIAEKLISEVMFHGKLEQLTMQSTLININSNPTNNCSVLSPAPSHFNYSQSSRRSSTPYIPSPSPESYASSSNDCHSVPPPSPSPSQYSDSSTPFPNVTKPPSTKYIVNKKLYSSRPIPVTITIPDSPMNDNTTLLSQSEYNSSFHSMSSPNHISHSYILPAASSPLPQTAIIDHNTTPAEFSQQQNTLYEGDGRLLKEFLIIKKK